MVLITGGMGFIGLHTARKFLGADENVIITRFHTWREPSFLKEELGKRVIVESLDTTSPFDCLSLVRKHNVDSIVHLAMPGLSALSPAEDFRVNMLGLVNLLEAGRVAGVRRFSIGSSVTVYGGLAGPRHSSLPSVQSPIDGQQRGIRQHCKNDQDQDERHDRGNVAQVDRVHQEKTNALLGGEKFSEDRAQQSQRKSKPQAGENFRNARGNPNAAQHLPAGKMHRPAAAHIDWIDVPDGANR